MTRRVEALNNHIIDPNLHEATLDAIFDAMEEHAIEFLKWTTDSDYCFNVYFDGTSGWKKDDDDSKLLTTEQLYKKFNSEKQNIKP